MATNTPSYLTSRGNIYYFQMRIPLHINNERIPRNRIIRRSTRTGNLREALAISRQWWLSIMNNDFFEETYPELAEFEKADNENDEKIKIGLSIIKEMKKLGIDEDDRISFDSYFDSGKCLECYHLAKDYKRSIKKIKKAKKSVKQNKKPETTPTPQAPQPNSISNNIESSELRLSDVMDQWVDFNMLKAEGKRWSPATKKSYLPIVKLMIEMVGDPLAHEFTKPMFRDKFVSRVTLLPDRLSTKKDFKDENGERLPLEECFEIAEENDLKRIGKTTIEKYGTQAGIFIRWASKHEFIAPNIDVVLELLQGLAKKDDRRKYFNNDELKALFETSEYQDGLLFSKPFRHWSILIQLYTGCRLGEACQFFIDDIFETNQEYSDGSKVWVFNFTNKGKGQKMKGKPLNYENLVPIHPDLIKLGFINYWKQQKNKGEKQLFSGVSPPDWYRNPSRWFNGETNKGVKKVGYAERYGVFTDDKRRITSHSFRYYISNRSKQEREWDYSIWCEFTNHSDGETKRKKKKKPVRQGTYEDDFELNLRVKQIEKLTFDFLDIDGIKKWE